MDFFKFWSLSNGNKFLSGIQTEEVRMRAICSKTIIVNGASRQFALCEDIQDGEKIFMTAIYNSIPEHFDEITEHKSFNEALNEFLAE